jgi:hypothetical protein
MTQDHKTFVDQELMLVNKIFNDLKEIRPMAILIKDNHRVCIPTHHANDAQKDIVSQGIKELVKRSEPDTVVFMNEGWMVQMKGQVDLDIKPSLHADRIEVVIVQIEFKTGEKFGCIADIIRDGKEAKLGKFDITHDQSSMGRFVDFFPPKHMN